MDYDQLDFLLIYNIRQARAISINPSHTIAGDIFIVYENYLQLKENYHFIIDTYKDHVKTKLIELQDLLQKIDLEADLMEKKILLVEALELERDLELLLQP